MSARVADEGTHNAPYMRDSAVCLPKIVSQPAGARFRREVLARGGSRPALESFVAFRGRKPESDALLRHNGMMLAA